MLVAERSRCGNRKRPVQPVLRRVCSRSQSQRKLLQLGVPGQTGDGA